jgi:hypothetical protein
MYEYHVVVRAIMEERMREAEHYRQNAGRRPPKPSPTARGGLRRPDATPDSGISPTSGGRTAERMCLSRRVSPEQGRVVG